eukprot:281117-Amphidinium_carterae.3
MTLDAYQQSHVPVSVGAQTFGSSSVAQHPGFLLDHTVHGARLFLGLKDLHDNVIGNSANMTASRWYQSWFPHWTKRLAPHGLSLTPTFAVLLSPATLVARPQTPSVIQSASTPSPAFHCMLSCCS